MRVAYEQLGGQLGTRHAVRVVLPFGYQINVVAGEQARGAREADLHALKEDVKLEEQAARDAYSEQMRPVHQEFQESHDAMQKRLQERLEAIKAEYDSIVAPIEAEIGMLEEMSAKAQEKKSGRSMDSPRSPSAAGAPPKAAEPAKETPTAATE
jgi:hypothetical protein